MAVILIKNLRKGSSQTRSGMKKLLNYCMKEAKTDCGGRRLITGVNCVPQSVFTEMMNTKSRFGKENGKLYYHIIQSFSPKENITPQKAHELAVEYAGEMFPGHEVLVATHTDAEHTHSHFVVNSVSFTDGRKLHFENGSLQKLRDASDEMCLKYGLSVIGKQRGTGRKISGEEYNSAARGESWKMQLIVTVEEVMRKASSKKDFIRGMRARGYEVKWTDERQNITYTTPTGMRCRDKKLFEDKFLKEKMENEFRIREIIKRRIEEESERSARSRRFRYDMRSGYGTELEGAYRFGDYTDRDADLAYGLSAEPCDEEGIIQKAYGIYSIPFRSGRETGADVDYDERYDRYADEECCEIVEGNPFGYGSTGWENERGVWAAALAVESGNEEVFIENASDISYSDGGFSDLGADTAYLAAGILNTFEDDDEPEDCTTMSQPKHERKNHGPVMGGM